MLWKARLDGVVVHEVHRKCDTDDLSTLGTWVYLRCGLRAFYMLHMAVTDPGDVPTTCIGCIADVEGRREAARFLRKAEEAAMRNAYVQALRRGP